MFIVRTIPVVRGTLLAELSYFSAVAYPAGSLVRVPMRTKEADAVVVSSLPVRDAKAALRTSGYALRKIRRQRVRTLVTPEYIHAAEKTAQHYASTTGAVLFSYMPKALRELTNIPPFPTSTTKPRLRGFVVPRLYQDLASGRLEFYRTSIREAFASGGSTFIVVPTVADAERVYEGLATGIEQYAFLLHGSLTNKEQQARIRAILTTGHPVLVVAPPSFLSIPRHDLTTIIMERESSSLYRSRSRPFVDAHVFVHELTAALGGQLFLADLPLRIASVYRKELGEYEEIVTGAHRMHWSSGARIINMQGVATSPKKVFRAISHELLDRMVEVGARGGRTFIYVARRGLSPVTLCRDCGTVVTCKECGASVVLHKGNEENHFLCHSCGSLRHARERCATCRSWRLEAFGIGTERIEQEIKSLLPNRTVRVLSSDTARTHGQAQRTIDAFYAEPASILIGTELALPYLKKHVPLVSVASLDALLSLASWNVYERIASTLTRLRELAGEELIVQTRRPEADILTHVIGGNFSGFYRSELRVRKTLGYPPYTVIIKVSVTGTQSHVDTKIQEARERLLPYELITFSRVLKAPGNKFTLHGFLRINRENWPNVDLANRLQALGPGYTIVVDPDSIL